MIFKKKNIFFLIYLFFTTIISVFLLELFLNIYFKSKKIPNDSRFQNRYMLFKEGRVFEKFDNFFKYHPNLNQRSLQYYFIDDKFKKIWDYNLITNNYGLVQKYNIQKNKKSILFLGDSFTEGQGAEPWIDKFGQYFKDYQLINGGIIGTGFQQFENLSKYFDEIFNIEYVVVLYIGGDIRRGLTLLEDNECLLDNNMCNQDFNFLSYPKNEKDIYKFLNKIKKIRSKKNKSLNIKIKNLIRNTYLYNILRTQLNNIRLKNDLTIQKNLSSIHNLIDSYKDKIIFINISTAEEIINKRYNYESLRVQKFLNQLNVSNYSCNLENDLRNYYEIDFHPNEKGYESIYNCVNKILQKNL